MNNIFATDRKIQTLNGLLELELSFKMSVFSCALFEMMSLANYTCKSFIKLTPRGLHFMPKLSFLGGGGTNLFG